MYQKVSRTGQNRYQEWYQGVRIVVSSGLELGHLLSSTSLPNNWSVSKNRPECIKNRPHCIKNIDLNV